MDHVADADHENDGGQNDGHDIDGFAGHFHGPQGPQATEQYDQQGNAHPPNALESHPQKNHQNDQSDAHEQRHFALHDIHIVLLGYRSSSNVHGVFPGGGERRDSVGQAIASGFGQELLVADLDSECAPVRGDKRAVPRGMTGDACGIGQQLGLCRFILPPQQWALHNRQAQFDGFLQARRTQYLFDVRKRLKFIHVPVHIRKKRRVIDARIVFHTDDEEVVIRFEM